MIKIDSVSLEIGGKTLVEDVNLTCHPGTVTALVGPNGAGKSSLLSLIAGERNVEQGEIWLNGRSIAKLSIREFAQERAIFPQGSEIRFNYPVKEIVAMSRAFRDLPPEEDDAVISWAMDKTEIQHLAGRNAQTLSGGEKARATYSRVLAQETKVLLLDEPIAALDLRHQERVLQSAREQACAGATVIAVLHDLNLAAAYSDQVALMQNGRLVSTGAPWDVLTENNISTVYQQDVCVLKHPVRECPVVLTR
ncbi:hemin ABC transporter ATP-binding protein [Rhodobacteraceae bacterium (ex Bugula neritina AB1)]|nr:hemin ABC transporter ATP-binding protein [Rhodobacteraceae bacterium (ex Bugula neritina AB1)]